MRKIFLLLTACTLLSCSPNVEMRGALKDPDWKEQIKPGQSTQADVIQTLGSPSARSTFGPETWYYISTRRESFAFLKPEVAEQDVTRITFETDGTVKTVDVFDKSTARDVEVSSRITPTEGHQMTFMEQVLGNLGRFNSPAGTGPGSAASNRHGGPAGR